MTTARTTQELQRQENYRVQVAQEVATLLQSGQAPWLNRADSVPAFPYNPASSAKRPYGAMNALWLMLKAQQAGYADPRWLTQEQAEAMGLRSKVGEPLSSVQLQFWQTEKTVEHKNSQTGAVETSRVKLDQPISILYHAINISQLNGRVPDLETRSATPETVARLLIERMAIPVLHDAAYQAPFYSHLKDQIQVAAPQEGKQLEYLASLMPALLQATGHQKRMAREAALMHSAQPNAIEEARVAIGAYFLCSKLGLPYVPPPLASGHAKELARIMQEDKNEVFRIARDANRMVDYLMVHVHAIERDLLEKQAEAHEHAASPNKGKMPMYGVSTNRDEDRVYLRPMTEDERMRAKALGRIRFDPESKLWYVPPDVDRSLFKEFEASGVASVGVNPGVVRLEFEKQCKAAGLIITGEIKAVGEDKTDWQRTKVTNTKHPSRKDGAYILYLNDSKPRGTIMNHLTGEKVNWSYDMPAMTPEQQQKIEEQARRERAKRLREQQELREHVAASCQNHWESISSDGAENQKYLVRKGVGAYGVKVDRNGNLVIPMRDPNGKMWSYQTISPKKDGPKLLAKDGQMSGNFHLVGVDKFDELKAYPAVLFAEGYATGASLHEATGLPVVIVFCADNIEPVLKIAGDLLPKGVEKIVCADNDMYFPERAVENIAAKGIKLNPNDSTSIKIDSGAGPRTVEMKGIRFSDGWVSEGQGKYKLSCEMRNGLVTSITGAYMPQNSGIEMRFNLQNTGVEKAKLAVSKHGGKVLVPAFKETTDRPTDFNDLGKQAGLAEVRQQVAKMVPKLLTIDRNKQNHRSQENSPQLSR